MSLQEGNKYANQGQYELAIKEWQKLIPDNPMYKYAQQNIERIKNLINKDAKNTNIATIDAGIQKTIKNPVFEQYSENVPLLSIVMPVYNVAPYLEASILSVLSQTLKNLELIIVNDASTDNSKAIIEMFAREDKRIRVINLEYNTLGGAGIPSNVGIKAARGKYLGFVDSDDFVVNDAFEVLVELAEKHQAETVIGDFVTFDEISRQVKTAYDQGKWTDMPIEQLTNAEKNPLLFHLAPVPWRKLYRMDFMKKHNILYPEVDYFYEDNPLHWSVLSKAERVIVTKKRISYHRMGRQGQTMGSDKYKLSSVCAHLNNLFHLAKKDVRPVIFDEFYDQWHRTDWIVDSQQKDSFEQRIIKKRLANIFHRASKVQPLRTKRTTFPARVADYTNAYPDMDLTIIISTYLGDNTINKCLDALLKIPEIKCNVLVVDNQLDIDLSKKLLNYQKNHKFVHIIQQKYRGLGKARNTVIPMCTGKYVLFLHDDSIVEPSALLKAYKQAISANNDILLFQTKTQAFDNGHMLSSVMNDEPFWKSNKRDKASVLLCQYQIDNKIIKSEFLHDNDIFFGGGKHFDEINFHWQAIIKANNLGFFDAVVCNRQLSPNKKTIPDGNGEEYKSLFNELSLLKKFLKTYDSQKLELLKGFATELFKSIEEGVPLDSQADFVNKRKEIIG